MGYWELPPPSFQGLTIYKGLIRTKYSCQLGSAHAPVNGGPVFPGTILGYFGLIKHFLAEFLLFSIILYITLAL